MNSGSTLYCYLLGVAYRDYAARMKSTEIAATTVESALERAGKLT